MRTPRVVITEPEEVRKVLRHLVHSAESSLGAMITGFVRRGRRWAQEISRSPRLMLTRGLGYPAQIKGFPITSYHFDSTEIAVLLAAVGLAVITIPPRSEESFYT